MGNIHNKVVEIKNQIREIRGSLEPATSSDPRLYNAVSYLDETYYCLESFTNIAKIHPVDIPTGWTESTKRMYKSLHVRDIDEVSLLLDFEGDICFQFYSDELTFKFYLIYSQADEDWIIAKYSHGLEDDENDTELKSFIASGVRSFNGLHYEVENDSDVFAELFSSLLRDIIPRVVVCPFGLPDDHIYTVGESVE